MIDKDYPMYQYSVFLNGNRDEQIVIRTDTFEELLEAKKNVNKILEKVEAKQEAPDEITCWSCGAKAEERSGVSKKTGKKWRGIFCSTDNKSHTKWL